MITYEDVTEIYYFGKLIECYEERIKKLQSCNCLSDIEKERLQGYYTQLTWSRTKQAEIQAFFDSISDKYLKDIFMERCVKLKSWQSVAYRRNLTADCVKMMCRRYFNKYIKEQSIKTGD